MSSNTAFYPKKYVAIIYNMDPQITNIYNHLYNGQYYEENLKFLWNEYVQFDKIQKELLDDIPEGNLEQNEEEIKFILLQLFAIQKTKQIRIFLK
jgi:hypothetical protein